MNDLIELPGSGNLEFVERLYADFAGDPASVPAEWRAYFESLDNGDRAGVTRLGPTFKPASIFSPAVVTGGADDERTALLQHRVDRLIRAYRVRGHIVAKVDPLSDFLPYVPELDSEYYGLGEADMERLFVSETMKRNGRLTLREILQRLRETYCQSIGAQFMHIDNLQMRHWLQERIEGSHNHTELSRAEQLRILTRLTDAVVFEEFIRKKFIGAKSFSLEGAESLIPLLDLAIEKAGEHGVQEIVLAMAHRGRLNVLANIIGKSPREIFREFRDEDPDLLRGGDVKYHLGYSNDWVTSAGHKVHLSLCFNPSHLEFVNPVALGRLRAKQDRTGDSKRERGLVILVHGDAAFIGEGVTQETLNLARLPGYTVGGAIHIVVNNQIGFTTSPVEGRSAMYATSVAKMLPAPIFHVNGEDPEAVAHCIRLAMEFRREFHVDAVIDMYCYRRLGHNEGDEPSFTQPLLYKKIEQRKPVWEGYWDHLHKLHGVSRDEAEEIATRRRAELDQELQQSSRPSQPKPGRDTWRKFSGGSDATVPDGETGVSALHLGRLLDLLTQAPPNFHVHPKLMKILETRREMARGERPLDWAAGEALALATLTTEGVRIRLSGQDCERGTFSHRHAVLHDFETGKKHMPLRHLAQDQAPVEIINSPLSEVAVLGFDYGYSLDYPNSLVMWEAQFGDFVNVAQVIIDQFIVSAEDKWNRLSGLVMLLPHGFEGQGPEHSSARMERFLALCAEDNIQVVVPTTPAQFFHVLRRQATRPWRKPLIVFTPKSMLRHPRAVSSLDECARGRFQRVIPDATVSGGEHVRRVLLCTGKLYYDLVARREELKLNDVAIIRLEQLYPFPREQLAVALAGYRDGTNVIWVQEEPENMGAWRFLRVTASMQLFDRFPLTGICRPESSSPATGSAKAHKLEQEQLLASAFSEDVAPRPRTETISGTKQR